MNTRAGFHAVLCATALLDMGRSAAAQDSADPRPDRSLAGVESVPAAAYGTITSTVLTIGAADFRPSDATSTSTIGVDYRLWNPTGPGTFVAPVQLPSGASINEVDLTACDTSPDDDFTFGLYRIADSGNLAEEIASGTSSGDGGCGLWQDQSIQNATIDNYVYSYFVVAVFGSNDFPPHTSDLKLRNVKVYWNRQVTPLDGTADFTDVPLGNAYRQYVEAAAAAGILGPCAAGQFCPDNPVTRAQLALVLARAFGLHWTF